MTTPKSGGVIDSSFTAGLPGNGKARFFVCRACGRGELATAPPMPISGTGSKKRKYKVGKSRWTTTNSYNGRRQINSGKRGKLIAYQCLTAESIISQSCIIPKWYLPKGDIIGIVLIFEWLTIFLNWH
jgi:hypothetical protein